MKPAQFEYFAPATLDAALGLLTEHADNDAKVLAGGQSLVPVMNFRLVKPRNLIDINGIPGLESIVEDGDWLSIGALTRQRAVEQSELVARHCPILTEATRWIGHVTIRNRGTVGGSIVHNDPSAEYPLVAILLGAEIGIRSSERSRRVAAADFLVTYLTTTLQADELVTEVRFPKLRPDTGWAFQEFARRHGDFAIAAAGVTLTMDGDLVKDVRIAIGGASPVAFRATDAEGLLRGRRWSEELVESAAARVAGMAHPDSDVHASAEYRAHLATVLVGRALKEARSRTR